LLDKSSIQNDVVATQPRLGSVNKLEWLICSLEGAFSLAFQGTGEVNVVFGNDMVTHSKTIYDENFNHKLTLKYQRG
jgi:hypothetical protein